jgi:DNA-binding NtrC family response regulator
MRQQEECFEASDSAGFHLKQNIFLERTHHVSISSIYGSAKVIPFLKKRPPLAMMTLTGIRVLFAAEDDRQSAILQKLIDDTAIVKIARTLPTLQEKLKHSNYDVVICGWRLQDATWHDILEAVHRRSNHLPVIVFCHWGGAREWLEAILAGAYGLLTPPYIKSSLASVLWRAMAFRHLSERGKLIDLNKDY